MPQQKLTQTLCGIIGNEQRANAPSYQSIRQNNGCCLYTSLLNLGYDFPVRRLITITRRITNVAIRTHRTKVIGSICGSFLFPRAEI